MLSRLSQYWPIPLLLVPAAFLFDPWLVLVQFFLMISLWIFVKGDVDRKMAFFKNPYVVAGILFFLFLLSRAIPFLSSAHPLGYDTGIYRFEIWSSLQALPDYISGLFLGLPLLTNVLGLFGLSVDQILYGGYFIVNALLFLSLWVFLKRKWGTDTALFGVFLLLISTVQWKAFSMLLYKQVFALALLLYGFYLLQKRSMWLLLLLVFLALLQPLDAFFLAASMMLFLPWAWFRSPGDRKYFASFLLIGVFSVLGLWILEPGFWADAWQIFSHGILQDGFLEMHLQQGIFLSLSDYGYQAAVLFVFGSLGWFFSFKREGFTVLHFYVLLVLIWIFFELFFYQRLLLQLDMMMILFASYALFSFYRSFVQDRFSQVTFALITGLLALPLFLQVWQYEPFFEEAKLVEVSSLCESLESGVIVVAAESYTSPWLRGWCQEQVVFGPGLFANPWSYEQWQMFWAEGSLEEMRSLVSELERPTYFYHSQKQLQERFFPELFESVGEGWYQLR
jgi:hypothetical protein